ncbi:hypothetical protein [Sphingomonas immobilis]|uniref:Uncharacterized protein n=1 Tax=Sphingomonas immobilis TaxID=3063997 RepID=A0ABT8ZZ28_9SPHN|nr:hypothetical protein [Sphingomonas sp. CA1-15]MDO7842447.1 hypothetical protein [Sphingomonas sp. CA1-15]
MIALALLSFAMLDAPQELRCTVVKTAARPEFALTVRTTGRTLNVAGAPDFEGMSIPVVRRADDGVHLRASSRRVPGTDLDVVLSPISDQKATLRWTLTTQARDSRIRTIESSGTAQCRLKPASLKPTSLSPTQGILS